MISILVTANHAYGPLQRLCGDGTLTNLPIAGKSLLEHLLEAVVELQVEQILIAASGDVVGTRSVVSDGERWGVSVNVVSAKTNESATEIYKRCSTLHDRRVLIVPCDRIYISTFEHMKNQLTDCAGAEEGVYCTESGLIMLPPNADISLTRRVENLLSSTHPIQDVVGFHSANLAAVNGELGAIRLSGSQKAVGLRQGYMTRIHPRSVASGHVYVGNQCHIHSTCKLSGPVVISHGVSIDRMTIIENSVVLDNTIIGEHLHVKDSIVFGRTIMRVDNGAVMDFTDKFLVTERGKGIFDEYCSEPLNRLAGAILFLLTLPVLMAALLAQFLRSPKSVCRKQAFIGNRISTTTEEREVFVTYLIDSPNSVFRRLPMILDVVAGNIRLFGVSVLTPEEHHGRSGEWQKVTEHSLAGLLGPTQLYVGQDAPLDERLLSDAISAQSGIGVHGTIELLIKCVTLPFSRDTAATL